MNQELGIMNQGLKSWKIFTLAFLILHFTFFIIPVPQAQAQGCCQSVCEDGAILCDGVPQVSCTSYLKASAMCESPIATYHAGNACSTIMSCPQYTPPPPPEEPNCNVSGFTCPSGQICNGATGNCIPLPKSGNSGSGVTSTTAVALTNPLGTTNVPVILGRLVAVMVGFAGAIGLIVVVYGGFQWLTAAGNPEKIKKGQEIMFWAIIGLVVMFGAYAATRYLIAALTQGRTLL